MKHIELPIATAALFFFVLVLPTWRTWRRHGTWPIVFRRETEPFQRLIGAIFGLSLIAIFAWTLGTWLFGPSVLGQWQRPPLFGLVGWVLFVAGAALVMIAQAQMGASWRVGIDDRPTALVTTGLFGYVRNPIFTGMLMALGGLASLTPSFAAFLGWFVVAALIALQVRFEERHLTALHGREYRAWASRVGRFLPGVGCLSFEQ
jgi:protein-S-isoprenylcysteine O-methyltransferase Ste14